MRTKIVPLMVFSLGALVTLAGVAAAQSEDPNPAVPRWTDAEYEVSITDDLDQIHLDGEADIHEVPPENRLLERRCGTSCSADELRDAYQGASETQQRIMVEAMEAAIEQRIEGALTGLGAANTTSSADVDEASLAEPTEGNEYQPPIPIDATGSGDLTFIDEAGVTPEQVRALFRMGAKVDQDVEVDVEAGTNLTLTLAVSPPPNMLQAPSGDVGDDGSAVTWTQANWKGETDTAIEDTVRLGDPAVEVPTESDAEVEVTLDIADVSVAYGSVLGDGAPARGDVAVRVDGRFSAIENPRELDRVELAYLSADALRLALDSGLLETRQLIDLEDRARQQIKDTFAGMTGQDVDVQGGFPAGDLTGDAVGEPPGTGEAITLSLEANATVPLPPERPTQQGAQGFTVTTFAMGDLDLPQPDVPYDVDTAITVVLPPGLELDYDEPEGYTVTETERDGRKAYTFASNGEGGQQDQAAIQNGEIVVNHPFVWDVFWPVLVTLALVLVVLPAVVIGLTIRRRRKYGPPTARESTSSPVSGSQSSQRSTGGDEE